MPQNQVQPTIFFLKCPVPSQENAIVLLSIVSVWVTF